jgi:Cof subfamily protein (haloacid dehalogenase superfamily)
MIGDKMENPARVAREEAAPPSAHSVHGKAPQLIVCDLDGTLLNSNGEISPRTVDVLTRAQQQGIPIVIATGRPVWWLDPVFRAGLTGIAVCMNGAVVYDLHKARIIEATPLQTETMVQFLQHLSEINGEYSVAVERVGVDETCCWVEANNESLWHDVDFQRGSREELVSTPIAKMMLRTRGGLATLAKDSRTAALGIAQVTDSSDFGMIEIVALGVNKQEAVSSLATKWGIDSTNVVAFGDMQNDIELLDWAGHAVAMSNGNSDVHRAADEITCSNDDHGVAVVLERWF